MIKSPEASPSIAFAIALFTRTSISPNTLLEMKLLLCEYNPKNQGFYWAIIVWVLPNVKNKVTAMAYCLKLHACSLSFTRMLSILFRNNVTIIIRIEVGFVSYLAQTPY